MHERRGSVEIMVVVLIVVIIAAAAWLYLGRSSNPSLGGPQAQNQPAGQSALSSTIPASQGQNQASNPNDPTSQYTLFRPAGSAAQLLGTLGSQFKVQFVAFTTIKTPGGSSWQYPFFNQYFYNEQTNSGWTYSLTAADGSGYLKAISLSMDQYGSFPALTMTYPVIDPDTGAIDHLTAQRLLPTENGTITFSPVGSVHPTGRVVFVVPTETTTTTLLYPGGTLTIDLQDQTITAVVTAPTGAPTVQTSPIMVTAAPLSWYSQNIQTYTDSSGSFSVEYPGSLTPDDSVNGNSGSYLDSELVDISNPDAPGFIISPQVNGSIYGIDVQYSSPVDLSVCENPGNENTNGAVPPITINNVNWYKATVLSNDGLPAGGQQGIDDIYQTSQGGKCWAFDFTWDASSASAPSYDAVSIFEESLLGTFHVLDASALPDTGNNAD